VWPYEVDVHKGEGLAKGVKMPQSSGCLLWMTLTVSLYIRNCLLLIMLRSYLSAVGVICVQTIGSDVTRKLQAEVMGHWSQNIADCRLRSQLLLPVIAIRHIANDFKRYLTVRLGGNRERKCADTIGTVPVPWAGHFQC